VYLFSSKFCTFPQPFQIASIMELRFCMSVCVGTKINPLTTCDSETCNCKTLMYTIHSCLKKLRSSHHCKRLFWNRYYTLLSIHSYYVFSHSMGLLSFVYPVVLFYHCIFHRVKLTPSAELYKLLLRVLSMFTHAKRFNFIPFSSN
jgi:hypothetical protein